MVSPFTPGFPQLTSPVPFPVSPTHIRDLLLRSGVKIHCSVFPGRVGKRSGKHFMATFTIASRRHTNPQMLCGIWKTPGIPTVPSHVLLCVFYSPGFLVSVCIPFGGSLSALC